jgi:hypothetical protein
VTICSPFLYVNRLRLMSPLEDGVVADRGGDWERLDLL